MQGAGRETTILDANFVDDVIAADGARHLVIDGVTLTHGVHGIDVSRSTAVTLHQSRSTGNIIDGVLFTTVSDADGVGDGEEVLLTGRDPLNPGDVAAVSDLVTNGGFEANGGSLTGWTRFNQTIGPGGGWFARSATLSPVRRVQLPAPPHGATAAIADSIGESILTLSQEILMPPAASVVLGVDVMVISAFPFITPEVFTFTGMGLPLSNQFRIDLLTPGTSILASGSDVLAPLFCTEESGPLRTGYRRLLFDLTPYAGQRVVLRFALNQTGVLMVSGIDNVRVLATGVSP